MIYKGAYMDPSCMHAKRKFQSRIKKKLEVRCLAAVMKYLADVVPDHIWSSVTVNMSSSLHTPIKDTRCTNDVCHHFVVYTVTSVFHTRFF